MQGRMRRAYQVLRALQSALCAMLWSVCAELMRPDQRRRHSLTQMRRSDSGSGRCPAHERQSGLPGEYQTGQACAAERYLNAETGVGSRLALR